MLGRIFNYAVQNTLRNTFLSISSVLVITLLIFFINILLVLHTVSFKLIDQINQKLTISLFLKDGYDKNSIEVVDLINDIKTFSNQIQTVYKTKEEALEELRKKDEALISILERTNPLPETITIQNISLREFEQLNSIIENKLFILSASEDKNDVFSNYTTQYKRIATITTLLHSLQIGLYIIIAIFFVSIAIIVYSIIGNFIYYYKDEIYITRLVGGSNTFVHGPFTIQGVIYTGTSFLLSLILFWLLLKNIDFVFATTYKLEFLFNNPLILLLEGIVFACIGGISGYLSSKKYIHMTK